MYKSVAGIIKKDNKFLLGKRKPGGSIGGKWEFPGGKVEDGENFKNSLEREFMEELGIKIEVKDFIIEKEFKSEDHNFNLYAFYIELLDSAIETNEHDEFKYFTLDEIKKLGNSFADSDKLLLDYIK